VYRHYNGEVRKNMAAGARLAELEADLAAAKAERDRLAAALGASRPAGAARRWRNWFGPRK